MPMLGPCVPAAALRDNVLCLPTDIHSLLVNKPILLLVMVVVEAIEIHTQALHCSVPSTAS